MQGFFMPKRQRKTVGCSKPLTLGIFSLNLRLLKKHD
jgi:hypothetical protein